MREEWECQSHGNGNTRGWGRIGSSGVHKWFCQLAFNAFSLFTPCVFRSAGNGNTGSEWGQELINTVYVPVFFMYARLLFFVRKSANSIRCSFLGWISHEIILIERRKWIGGHRGGHTPPGPPQPPLAADPPPAQNTNLHYPFWTPGNKNVHRKKIFLSLFDPRRTS